MRLMTSILFLSIIINGCQKEKTEYARQFEGEGLKYLIPEGWVAEEPANTMRKAQYRLPGIDGAGDAECVLFVFPGTGGTVAANLQRWYGQFKQPDGADSRDLAEVENSVVNDLSVTVTYVSGTYLKPLSQRMMGGPVEEVPGSALLAAVIETPDDPWFFKCVGPEKTVNHWRNSFSELLTSIHYSQQ